MTTDFLLIVVLVVQTGAVVYIGAQVEGDGILLASLTWLLVAGVLLSRWLGWLA